MDISYTSKKVSELLARDFFVATQRKKSAKQFEQRLVVLKDRILGSTYELSLVFADASFAQQLNVSSRGKDYTPNVLSFPLTSTSGEIYICPAVALLEAGTYEHAPIEHLAYLFIHGCLHLTGLDHGKEMDRLEQHYLGVTP